MHHALKQWTRGLLTVFIIGSTAAVAVEATSTATALPWIAATGAPLPTVTSNQQVIRFIGAGGIYLGNADSAVLVDPFYTNPSLWQIVSLKKLDTDKTLVDRYLPSANNVQAVLVGHAHYDHALDIPYILSRLPAEAKVYGSETLSNMLAPDVPPTRRVSVEPLLAKEGQGGQWLQVSPRLRIFPIESEHSPHIGSWVVAGGKLHKALQQLPADALGWVAGTPVSYLVDFLDAGGSVSYRAFVQTSSATPPKGVPPKAVLEDGHPVDVAVLCAANYNNVNHYPDVLLQTMAPREVVIVHWEKFWEPYVINEGTPLPGLDLQALYQKILAAAPQAKISLPQRGAQFLLQDHTPPGGNPHGQ